MTKLTSRPHELQNLGKERAIHFDLKNKKKLTEVSTLYLQQPYLAAQY